MLGKSQVDPKTTYIPKLKNSSIKSFPLKEGVYDTTLKLTNNESWPITVSVPKIVGDEKVPLIIALHWAGRQNTYKEFGNCLAFPGLDALNGIIVVPSSKQGNWLLPENEQRIIDLVRKAIKHWPVAKDKVLITGYSNGGIASWQYAIKYPRLFSVGIAMAGKYKKARLKIPMYVIHSKGDELFSFDDIQKTVVVSKNLGSSIELTIINELSHYVACSYMNVLRAKAIEIKGIFSKI
ncbi:hypothetical protein MHTCC0001_34180 [Flavobacteriaceae bacterium MHTCC 0001]